MKLIKMSRMNEPEIWDVLQCTECDRYVDKETGEIVPKPKHGRVVSHTVCEECAVDIIDLRREMLKRKRWAEAAAARPRYQEIRADRAVRYCVLHARFGGPLGMEAF